MAPLYASYGDQAITFAEKEYLKCKYNNSEIITIYEPDCLKALESGSFCFSEDDVFFFQGGGNFGSLYPETEICRQRLITLLGDQNITLFPQSVYFDSSAFSMELLKKSVEVYSRNNIKLIAREQQSYSFFKEHYPKATCALSFDMVIAMKSCFDITKGRKRSGIILSLRNDKEKYITPNMSELNSCLTKYGRVSYVDMFVKDAIISESEQYRFVHKMLDIISSSELVITDRLHGMIFSLITKTPCIVFDNIYNKNFSVLEMIEPINYITPLAITDCNLIEKEIDLLINTKEYDDFSFEGLGNDILFEEQIC